MSPPLFVSGPESAAKRAGKAAPPELCTPRRVAAAAGVVLTAVAAAILTVDLLALRSTSIARIGRVRLADADVFEGGARRAAGASPETELSSSPSDALRISFEAIDVDISANFFSARLCGCAVRVAPLGEYGGEEGGEVVAATLRHANAGATDASCADIERGPAASDLAITATFATARLSSTILRAVAARSPLSVAVACDAALGVRGSPSLLPLGRYEFVSTAVELPSGTSAVRALEGAFEVQEASPAAAPASEGGRGRRVAAAAVPASHGRPLRPEDATSFAEREEFVAGAATEDAPDLATRLWGAPALSDADFALRSRSLFRLPLSLALPVHEIEVALAGVKVAVALSENGASAAAPAPLASTPVAAAAILRVAAAPRDAEAEGADAPLALCFGLELGLSPAVAGNSTRALLSRAEAVARRALLGGLARALSALAGEGGETSTASASDTFIDALDSALFGSSAGAGSEGRRGQGTASEGEGEGEGEGKGAGGAAEEGEEGPIESPFRGSDGSFSVEFLFSPLASPNAFFGVAVGAAGARAQALADAGATAGLPPAARSARSRALFLFHDAGRADMSGAAVAEGAAGGAAPRSLGGAGGGGGTRALQAPPSLPDPTLSLLVSTPIASLDTASGFSFSLGTSLIYKGPQKRWLDEAIVSALEWAGRRLK
jgi:hypothetical protein